MEQNNKTEKKHTNKAAIAVVLSTVGLFAAADIAARYFLRQQPAAETARSTVVTGSGEKPEAEPKAYVPVRGDGVCEQSESYPYKRDANGKVLTEKDAQGMEVPVPNPDYSKEDCHFGDNVCDSDLANIQDPAGNMVLQLFDRDGKAIQLQSPLESDNLEDANFSPDCVRVQCQEVPDQRDPNVQRLPRPMLAKEKSLMYLRQLTQGEIESMHNEPGFADPDENYFVRLSRYEETCDSYSGMQPVQLCGPLTEGLCRCPNLQACKPREVAVAPPPPEPIVCGNGKVQADEQCDPPQGAPRTQGCNEGQTCNRNCQCVETPQPPRPPPVPRLADCTGQDLSSVTGGNGWGTLVTRVQAAVDRARNRLREQLGYASSSDTVTVTTKIRVSTSGVPSLYSASAPCIALDQESCPSSREMLDLIGSVNFSNAQAGSPSRECLVPVPKPLRP